MTHDTPYTSVEHFNGGSGSQYNRFRRELTRPAARVVTVTGVSIGRPEPKEEPTTTISTALAPPD